MAEMILPIAALAGIAHAAPQLLGINLGANAGASAAATVSGPATIPVPSTHGLSSVSIFQTPLSGQVVLPVTSSISAAAGSPISSSPISLISSLPVSHISSLPVANSAVAVPSLPNVAASVPTAGLTNVANAAGILPTDSANVPAILVSSLPTGSITKIIQTTLPVANTGVLSSLAALTENAAVAPIASSAMAELPTSGLPAVPTPTNILPASANIPVVPTQLNGAAALINGIGPSEFGELASKIADIFQTLENAAGTATSKAALPTDIYNALTAAKLPTAASVTALPTGLTAPNISVPIGKGKRQLEAVTTALTGALGASSPVNSVVSAVSGAGGANVLGNLVSSGSSLDTVGSLVGSTYSGSSALDLLAPAVGGDALTGLPAGTLINPIGKIGSSTSGLSSLTQIVMKTKQIIPIPANFASFIPGIKTAALADIQQTLAGTALLSKLLSVLAVLNTLASLNSAFAPLSSISNLPSLQSAILFITPSDLAATTYLLSNAGSLPSLKRDTEAAAAAGPIPLGSLLEPANAVQFAAMLQTLQVSNQPASMAYALLAQTGFTDFQNLVPGVDTSVVTKLLANLPTATVTNILAGLVSSKE
ncbi:Hypothetical predicted protein [Lecanosticta acicola]|uniref:PUL domain-containing protein n=1 Tax=Lecanosticta acicola TaxID=111012 RepID=A0AAI9EAE5_9PEZI|nr:Hypothetical predicted protein [Lecanosticta acicola]